MSGSGSCRDDLDSWMDDLPDTTTEQPRPEQASGTTINKQSDLFPRYTFKVVTGRYKVIDNRSDSEPKVRQIATADGEDEARMIIEALNATERHDTPTAPERADDGVNRYLKSEIKHLLEENATLIAQRERLLAAIRKFVDYYDGANAARLGNGQARRSLDEFREAITTSEQEGRRDE